MALWQAHYVGQQLQSLGVDYALLPLTTQGDQQLDSPVHELGGKGVFLKNLEQALLEGTADIAVHSLKDVPAHLDSQFSLAALLPAPERRDVWISRNCCATFEQLPKGARIGTSSPRRVALLKHLYPDYQPLMLRGNVNTRLARLEKGDFEAIILSGAGMQRLGICEKIGGYFDPHRFIPAAGQGALAIEVKADHQKYLEPLATLHCHKTARLALAERATAKSLHGGCHLPLGVYAEEGNNQLSLRGCLLSPDGSQARYGLYQGHDPETLGNALAEYLLQENGQTIFKQSQMIS